METVSEMRLAETLISAEQIQSRVAELGREISEKYARIERPLVLIGILK